jgi:membrane protein YdbS with pleckstrin-like domain
MHYHNQRRMRLYGDLALFSVDKTDLKIYCGRFPTVGVNTMAPAPFQIGETFKPAPQFRSYLYAYFIVFIVILILPWFIPIILFTPLPVSTGTGIILLIIIVFVLSWIPRYFTSIAYELSTTEISWKRGVWFQQTGIVPYNRITNVDIMQGPLMRHFSFSALRVQTAGYSAQAKAEIHLNGIENPKVLQEMIMGYVRSTGPVATEGEPEGLPAGPNEAVLNELRAIRQILERNI